MKTLVDTLKRDKCKVDINFILESKEYVIILSHYACIITVSYAGTLYDALVIGNNLLNNIIQ